MTNDERKKLITELRYFANKYNEHGIGEDRDMCKGAADELVLLTEQLRTVQADFRLYRESYLKDIGELP